MRYAEPHPILTLPLSPHWVAACTLHIGQISYTVWIHNVIMLPYLRHIIICNNALLRIGKETKSIVSEHINILLPPDNPPVKLHFELSEAWAVIVKLLGVGHRVSAS